MSRRPIKKIRYREKVKYSSVNTKVKWWCLNCSMGGRGGHFPAQSHHLKTGHRVMVEQINEYLYG